LKTISHDIIYREAPMSVKKSLAFLPALLVVGLLIWLSGCGTNVGTGSMPASKTAGKPDSVKILVDLPIGQPAVTLTIASMVQQLYAAIYALPQMPASQACTAERGPHYTLTFRQGDKTLVTVIAMRDGCRPVSIAGETHDRQATQEFWAQLDQAIYHASPPARVQWLALMRVPRGGQSSQTARILSAAPAQSLYDAILALPLATPNNAYLDGSPAYQLVFHAADQMIPSAIDMQHNLVSLNGNLQSRTGLFKMNDQFKRVLEETLAAATFTPAHPDTLSFLVQKEYVASQPVRIDEKTFIAKFYANILALQPSQPQPGCPSGADKVAGKATWYDIRFTQWSLPVLQVSAYEGSCKLVEIGSTGQQYQGNQEFWDLVHQAAGRS
jgi:hypothetical protein